MALYYLSWWFYNSSFHIKRASFLEFLNNSIRSSFNLIFVTLFIEKSPKDVTNFFLEWCTWDADYLDVAICDNIKCELWIILQIMFVVWVCIYQHDQHTLGLLQAPDSFLWHDHPVVCLVAYFCPGPLKLWIMKIHAAAALRSSNLLNLTPSQDLLQIPTKQKISNTNCTIVKQNNVFKTCIATNINHYNI